MQPPAVFDSADSQSPLDSHGLTEGLAAASSDKNPVCHPQALDIDPPPYSPGLTLPRPQLESYFRIPPSEPVVSKGGAKDSIRLPNYSGRALYRYHPYRPYIRPTPNPESVYDERRYTNTILDDEYVPLDVPPLIRQASAQPQVAVVDWVPLDVDVAAPPAPGQEGGAGELDREEQYRRRLHRLRAVIMDFFIAVTRANEARRPHVAGGPARAGDP